MALWNASTTRFTLQCASRKDVKPVRRQRSQVKGRKRHILVDTLGLLLSVVVHPADIQDRDGAFQLLRRARRLFPFIKRIFADGGYAGEKMALIVWRTGAWRLQIVKRSDAAGFEVEMGRAESRVGLSYYSKVALVAVSFKKKLPRSATV